MCFGEVSKIIRRNIFCTCVCAYVLGVFALQKYWPITPVVLFSLFDFVAGLVDIAVR